MSSAFKTLKSTDISVVPYVAKKLATYTSCSADEDGIRAYKGKYTPPHFSSSYKTIKNSYTGSTDKAVSTYFSIDNLFYRGYISGSGQSASLNDLNLQTLGASGSSQTDVRKLPPQQDIKIISIPQSVYGERIVPGTFKLKSDTSEYYLVDDKQGNVIDINNYTPTQLSDSDIYDGDFIYNYYKVSSSIGNIVYSQGLVIITNYDYYCVVDAGPTVLDEYSITFQSGSSPKQILAVSGSNVSIDCMPISASSLQLQAVDGYSFPAVTYNSTTRIITLSEGDVLTNTPGIYQTYYTLKSTGCASSNTGKLVVTIQR